MRLRHCLLATTLLAGTAGATSAQDPKPRTERRPWIRTEPFYRHPMTDFYHFRIHPDRMRIVERALERAERARNRSIERASRMRDRELEMRERAAERVRSSLRYSRELRERAMERVRERLDYLREEHRHMIRRRLRTV